MSTSLLTQPFESFISDSDSIDSLVSARPDDRPYRLFEYIGKIQKQLRIMQDVYSESPSESLNSCIKAFTSLLQNTMPKAAQFASLTMAALEFSDDGEEWTTCGNEIQKHNREALDGLRDADSLSQRWDVIKDWGGKIKDDLGKCVDEALGNRGGDIP